MNTIQSTETALEKNSELRARVSILSEKRLRLLKDITLREAEVKSLHHAIHSMHSDMSRLNELIGRNTKLQAELANANAVMEMEFKAELKELETESVTLETKIHEVKEAKGVLLEEIVETERQLLLWEKKIQLERETQAALDPEVGMSEIKAMEKEIHRMRLRLETLKREQERMIVEMERSIYKRESISLRFKGKARPSAVEYTQATLRKKVAALRRSIQQTARGAAKYSGRDPAAAETDLRADDEPRAIDDTVRSARGAREPVAGRDQRAALREAAQGGAAQQAREDGRALPRDRAQAAPAARAARGRAALSGGAERAECRPGVIGTLRSSSTISTSRSRVLRLTDDE